jgi:type IV secretory pathway component VirB8
LKEKGVSPPTFEGGKRACESIRNGGRVAAEGTEERLERFEQTLLRILIPVCIVAVVITVLLVFSVIFS